LSVNDTEAERVPAALGVNATASVHRAEAASEEPQLLVMAKSPALGPVTRMLEKVKVALPTLVTVAVRGALVLPVPWLAKLMAVELNAKPAVGTGMSSVLPAPPQDADHKAMETQAAARTASFPRPLWSTLAPIPNDSLARIRARQ